MDNLSELLTRGVANIIPSAQELEKRLKGSEKLNIYLGIDPTATKIHLGHAMPLRKINSFALLGHNVTFLIGDFTALIGDTSDKDSERPSLTKEEVEENFQTYKKQAEKILDFSKIQVKYNSEWLSKLTFEEIIKIAEEFSAGDFLGRELIKKRLSEGKRVGLHEFLYPVMQGYDSYFMNTDVQVGGADQVFNMQAGRILQKSLRNKESFVLCTEYLMGTDGRKMSKSWGNAIWLDDNPQDMYAKALAINDDQVLNYYLLATNTSTDSIPSEEEINKNPLEAKKKLAFKIVSELHSESDARIAEEKFKKTVQNKETPEDIPEITVEKDQPIDENFLVQVGFATSRSDAKRLFEQNAVSLDHEKIKSGQSLADEPGEGLLLTVGRKMLKLNISD